MAKLMSVAFLLAAAFSVVPMAVGDPGPINDYCVANLKNPFIFNGLAYKSPLLLKASNFTFMAFCVEADTNNPTEVGLALGFATINYSMLNTQALSLAKINYTLGSLVAPLTHPSGADIITVTKDTMYVGFVDTASKLFVIWLKKGDFFLFPQGLVHFILNDGSPPGSTSTKAPSCQF